MADCYIGVDIGTQGAKAAVYDARSRCLGSAFEPSRLITPAPGRWEQSAEEIFASVAATVRAALASSGIAPERVACLGLDGQMAGILPVDEKYRALAAYDSWLDARCADDVERMKFEAERDIIETTGCPVTFAHGPKILNCMRERPEIYKQTAKFVTISSYVAGRLCALSAEEAFIDYTHLHFSGFGDNRALKWSGPLIERFGVDARKLPDIVRPSVMAGRAAGEAARECGLISGTPVACGLGDQAAASLGAGVDGPGICFDVAGTASVFSICQAEYRPDVERKTILFARHADGALYQPMAYISGGGLCLGWLRDNVLGGRYGYDEMNAAAEKIAPGCEGLVFSPHFAGRACPSDALATGMFRGLTWKHTWAHMYRAIMESIAFEYRRYADILGARGRGVVYAVGGGSASRVFNQIKADALGMDYVTRSRGDTSTLGAAMIAAKCVGSTLAPAGTGEVIRHREGDIYARFAERYEALT